MIEIIDTAYGFTEVEKKLMYKFLDSLNLNTGAYRLELKKSDVPGATYRGASEEVFKVNIKVIKDV